MTDEGFSALSKLAYIEAGLVLAPSKSAMIQSRLRHRLKTLNLSNLTEYCNFVQSSEGENEKPFMISALTTNVSSFFREPHHFDIIGPGFTDLLEKKVKSGEKVRIWSAGCSNGQEPYSLAIHILQTRPSLATQNLRILATDIDCTVLDFAKRGTYEYQDIEGVSEHIVSNYFEKDTRAEKCLTYRVTEQVREMVSFKKLNLMHEWPMLKKYDLIFCRNVVIYFDSKTQEALWPKFHALLKVDGIICVGHSERINHSSFEAIGPTAYKRLNRPTEQNTKTTERIA